MSSFFDIQKVLKFLKFLQIFVLVYWCVDLASGMRMVLWRKKLVKVKGV